MSVSLADHYAVLGVERTATAADIRAAYFRLVRENPPETNPERFRLISEAFRVLSNPSTRAEYDREGYLPPKVAERLDAIMEGSENDPATAAQALGRLVSQYPSLARLRFLYGVLLSRANLAAEAVREFEKLCRGDPCNPEYLTWYGDALIKSDRAETGLAALRAAIATDPDHSAAYQRIAMWHMEHGDQRKAAEVLERGIMADGTVDIRDLPLLAQLLYYQGAADDFHAMQETSQRIIQTIPAGDTDAKHTVVLQLWPVFTAFMEGERLDLAHVVAKTMQAVDPENAQISELMEELGPAAKTYAQARQLVEDDRTPQWLKALVVAFRLDSDATKEQRSAILVAVTMQLVREPNTTRSAWQWARRVYPLVLEPLDELWTMIESQASKAPKGLSLTQLRKETENSGCLALIAALAGTLVILFVLIM